MLLLLALPCALGSLPLPEDLWGGGARDSISTEGYVSEKQPRPEVQAAGKKDPRRVLVPQPSRHWEV